MIFGISKKVILGLLSMLLVFAIIVVSSFFPFILDPSKIATKEFLTNTLIVIAITISATISMMFVSQASNSSDSRSEIAKAKVEFEESLKKIDSRTKFYQWVERIFQPQDKIRMIEERMNVIGFNKKYYDLEDYQLKALTENPQKYENEFYKKITKEQVKLILEIKKKVNRFKFVKGNYYTSVKTIDATKTHSELASSENLKKVLTVVFQLALRIISTTIAGMILTSLVVDLTQDQNQAQAWMTFMSRMFSFASSSFLGYLLGCKLNDLDAFYIKKRIDVHIQFREDKTFVEIDEEKEEFKERVRQETLLLGGGSNGKERES